MYLCVYVSLRASDSEAVTVTVGRQQDKEEDTVTAVPVGQIPAAQQLHQHVPGHGTKVRGFKGQRGHTRQRGGIAEGLASQLHETTRKAQ